MGSVRNAGLGRSQPIGVAVVGAGYWGPEAGPQLRRDARSSLLRWLCDLDKSRAETALGAYSTVGATSDLDAVLADPQVDAIAIATPAGYSLRPGVGGSAGW